MHKQGISITTGKEVWDQGSKKQRSCGKVICITEAWDQGSKKTEELWGVTCITANKRDTGKVNELMSRDLMAILEYHMVLGAEE